MGPARGSTKKPLPSRDRDLSKLELRETGDRYANRASPATGERTYFFAAFFLRAAMVASYITGVPIMMDA